MFRKLIKTYICCSKVKLTSGKLINSSLLCSKAITRNQCSSSFLKQNEFISNCCLLKRTFYTTQTYYNSESSSNDSEKEKKDSDKSKNKREDYALIKISDFEKISNKNKNTFLDMIHLYEGRNPHRRAHVEFIMTALKYMEDFGVEKDLETYKKLIDVLPKGKFIPTNMFQVEFFHYPKQQRCALDVLDQMEDNGVIPDAEMETMLINIFGSSGHPVRKFWRMMYWMPKFKNLSPWPVPKPPPNDALELAKLAVTRITSVDLKMNVSVYNSEDVKDSLDKTWIVSGQSPAQKELLSKHPVDVAIFVEGGFQVWLRNQCVTYFILRSDPPLRKELPPLDTDDLSNINVPFYNLKAQQPEYDDEYLTVHEQDDGTILAVCATGTSSRDSLLSWIRLMQEDGNPKLSEIPVLFKLRSPSGEIVLSSSEMVSNNSS